MFNRLLAQLCGVCMVLFWIGGHNWISEGAGLHPMIAGAGCVIALVLPHLLREDTL